MKKFILTESEKNDIRRMYGLITEQNDIISQYVTDTRLQKILEEIQTEFGEKFTEKHFKKELELSGGIKKESGGILPEVVDAFNKMKNESGCTDIFIKETDTNDATLPVSYRTYEDQKRRFINEGKTANTGQKIDFAMKRVSIPGFSQHHTGYAVDYGGNTICLRQNAWPNGDFNNPNKWGFTLPYMSGNIRMKEPWHLQFVGTQKKQFKSNTTTPTTTQEPYDSEKEITGQSTTQPKTGTLKIQAKNYDELFKEIRDKTTGISIDKNTIDLDFTSKTFSVDYGNEKIEKIFLIMGRKVVNSDKSEITMKDSFDNNVNSIRKKYYLEPIPDAFVCQDCYQVNGVDRPIKYQLFIALSSK